MSELKACPVCDENAQEFFGYDYGLVGCKNEDCNYSFSPQHPDDWDNRPHENKLKADAIHSAITHAAKTDNHQRNSYEVYAIMAEYANKLERGEL